MGIVPVVAGQDARKMAKRSQDDKAVEYLVRRAQVVESAREPALGEFGLRSL